MQIPLPYGLLMIDGTITVGNIIEIATIGIGGLVFLLKQNTSINFISKEVVNIKDELKELRKIATDNAVINSRISNVEEDVRELKHGRGFVQNGLNGRVG